MLAEAPRGPVLPVWRGPVLAIMLPLTGLPWRATRWTADEAVHNPGIRRHGQTVQACAALAARWADVPALSSCVDNWPWSWQQVWQQSSACCLVARLKAGQLPGAAGSGCVGSVDPGNTRTS